MNRVLKTLLLWLLIAALPAQGFAAVMKASCGPTHHHALSLVSMAHGHHHDSHASDSHHHDDVSMHAVADSAASDTSVTADNSSDVHKHKSAYCSDCAACCFGAVAPPSAFIQTPERASSEAVVVSPALLVAGYIPSGLERPPRHISA